MCVCVKEKGCGLMCDTVCVYVGDLCDFLSWRLSVFMSQVRLGEKLEVDGIVT